MQITNAEAIGAGALWRGPISGLDTELPEPFPTGTPMGQHLRVRRVARVTEGKILYVVDNLGPKWSRRKCWACGNKYSPNTAQACSYCSTPLRDLEFLMTSRWNRRTFAGFEQFARLRLRHLGLITPVAVLYRADQMMSVYHYNGEGLLVDEPSPLPGDVVLTMGRRLSETLAFLHSQGVVLERFGPQNVVVMPDGSVRWFDLDVRAVVSGRSLYDHPDNPILRDVRNLGAMLRGYCAAEDPELGSFLQQVADGDFPTPFSFADAAGRLLSRRESAPFDSRCFAYTDVGLTREHNEHAWAWRDLGKGAALYLVADGMGGHERGELASRLANEAIVEKVTAGVRDGKRDAASLEKLLAEGLDAANAAVFGYARKHRLTMGTAIVAALVADARTLLVAHAGDCRAYLLRDGVLRRLTTDHSLVQELLADGQITPEQAKDHPRGNVLTVVVGGEDELEYEMTRVPIQAGDRVLLCSDGLWNEVEDEEIASYLHTYTDRRTAIQMLTRTAYGRAASDNLTMQIIDL